MFLPCHCEKSRLRGDEAIQSLDKLGTLSGSTSLTTLSRSMGLSKRLIPPFHASRRNQAIPPNSRSRTRQRKAHGPELRRNRVKHLSCYLVAKFAAHLPGLGHRLRPKPRNGRDFPESHPPRLVLQPDDYPFPLRPEPVRRPKRRAQGQPVGSVAETINH